VQRCKITENENENEILQKLINIITDVELLEKDFLQEYEGFIENLNIDFVKRFPKGRPAKYVVDDQKRYIKRIYNKTYYNKKRENFKSL